MSRTQRRPLWARALMLGGFSLVVAIPANAEFCARAEDMPPLQTRVLQTELMVAALTCNERPRYNAFVRMHRDELVVRGHQLKAFFKRTQGAQAQSSLDSFITRLANEASMRTIEDRETYCQQAEQIFDQVLGDTNEGQLGVVASASPTAESHGVSSCVPLERHAKNTH